MTKDIWKRYCRSISNAMLTQEEKILDQAVHALEEYLIEDYSMCPENVFQEIISILKENNSCKNPHWCILLNLFAYDLEYLNSTQQLTLASALKEIYPRLEEPANCIVCSETLTEILSEDEALETILNWIPVSGLIAKALIPNALYFLFKKCKTNNIRATILYQINLLANDSLQEVREEAHYVQGLINHKYS